MKRKITALILSAMLLSIASAAQDPGWPRQKKVQGATLVYYQPQIDEWKDFKELKARMAFTLTPPDAKPVVGVVSLTALTNVNVDQRMVQISNLQTSKTSFPSLDPAAAASMDKMVRTFLPPTYLVNISLDRLVASVNKAASAPTVPVRNDPPVIFVSHGPALLLSTDGKPVLAEIKKTKLQFLVNTNWPVFFDKSTSSYFLWTEKQWLSAQMLQGPWAATTKLPKDMSKLPKDPQWASMKKAVPPPASTGTAIPRIFYSDTPAEVIMFSGSPLYTKIPQTELVYGSNTESDLFVYKGKTYYYLVAGRWFSSSSLQGPWTYATPNLPSDFANMPRNNPAARVLVSVPGTDEAKDAVLLAQIPTTMVVNSAEAAAKAKVTYSGEPEFKPIEGTSMSYATNTADKVIKAGDLYYLCLQGIWFVSPNPQGPWQTATSVPRQIYTIPPSSPVYNVTYVTQSTQPSGTVESSYTAGYLGMFIVGAAVGATIAGGTGYYYPPYIYYPPYGYPVYRPYPTTYGVGSYYNPYTGSYGAARGVYGPYGGATRAAAYNPYTGTYARGASVYGPYGHASAGQAYNPYTGTYAARAHGSSPYGSWGSSVVTKGNQSVAGQHITTAYGTTGSMQTSAGGKAVARSSDYGSGFAGKTASGDMYAGHDGNVYKNTDGGWQKYDNGSWSSVSPSASARANAQSYQQQNRSATTTASRTAETYQRPSSSSAGGFSGSEQLNREFQNRQRGSAQTQRFNDFQRSGGGWSGGAGRGGGGRGGRRR